jgi:hypothetical protein
MERTARLVLHRLTPPFRRVVAIRRITLGGYLELLRTLAPKVAQAALKSKVPLDMSALIEAGTDADSLSVFADLVAIDQPAGFMRGWLHGRLQGAFAYRNTAALLAATRAAEGDGQWTRYLGTLNAPASSPTPGGAGKRRGGGLMADALTVARMFNLHPDDVLAKPLQDFLNLCEGINLMAIQESHLDPTMDPDAEASEIAIPGLYKVH